MDLSGRFDRQIKLIGEKAQQKLRNSRILIIGVGALGSLVSELAVRSGVKNLVLIDFDKVDRTNLHRQFLYYEDDIGKFKVNVAKETLAKIDSKIEIIALNMTIDNKNIENLKSYDPDLIIECSDNFKLKKLVSDFSIDNNFNTIIGSVSGNEGYVFFVNKNFDGIEKVFPNTNLNININHTSLLGISNTSSSLTSIMQWRFAFDYLINDYIEEKIFYFNKNSFLLLNRLK